MGLGRCVGRRGGWKERVNKRHESYALCGKKLGMGMGQDASAYMENLTRETDVMYNSSNA